MLLCKVCAFFQCSFLLPVFYCCLFYFTGSVSRCVFSQFMCLASVSLLWLALGFHLCLLVCPILVFPIFSNLRVHLSPLSDCCVYVMDFHMFPGFTTEQSEFSYFSGSFGLLGSFSWQFGFFFSYCLLSQIKNKFQYWFSASVVFVWTHSLLQLTKT